MSIDLCDLSHGTVIDIGKSIHYHSGHFRIDAGSTVTRGSMRRPQELSTVSDIDLNFKVPIDLRAISFSFLIDARFGFSCNIRNTLSLKLSTLRAQEVSTFNYTGTELPIRIFRCQSLQKSAMTIVNKEYQISDNMRRRGFHMDPCFPLSRVSESHKGNISPECSVNCQNIAKLKISFRNIPEGVRLKISRLIVLGQPSDLAFSDPCYRSITDRILNHIPEIPRTPVKSLHRRRLLPFQRQTSTSRGLAMVEASTRSSTEIPEDFVDPFTHQLMEFPMLMPSGKSCDKVYLDKYNRLELKWSRQPNDPFSSEPFTDQRPAVPDTNLKKRIDRWCLLLMLNYVPDWYEG